MASHNETWRGVRRQCEAMLGEVASASLLPGSVAASSNLYTSLAVLRSWEELGQDPTTISKNKNSKKYKKRNFIFDLSDPLVDFMAKQKVFYYPSLLPTCALAQDTSRISWTLGEDALLALALANTAPTLTKTGLTELSYALQAKYMRAKSAVQIRARIKNLKLRDSEEAMNPVVKFIKTAEAGAGAAGHPGHHGPLARRRLPAARLPSAHPVRGRPDGHAQQHQRGGGGAAHQVPSKALAADPDSA